MDRPSIALAAPATTRHPDGWTISQHTLYAGIPARLTVRGADSALIEACWRHLLEAERHISVFAPTSDLARLNAAAIQDGQPLSPELERYLQAALDAFHLSRGTCDASAGALVAVWRRAVREQRWPEADELAGCLARVGCAGVAIVDGVLRCPGRRLEFDLGGVVKGVLVDEVDWLLLRAGVEDALVQIGGETSCRGRGPAGRAWRVGVQHPLVDGALWTVLEAPDSGLSCSTSGDYRRAWRIGDRPVSHLIDPRNGAFASDDLLSATVAIPLAGRAGASEALTKAAVFLPPGEALAAGSGESAELLVLRAADHGMDELRSPGWRGLEAGRPAARSAA